MLEHWRAGESSKQICTDIFVALEKKFGGLLYQTGPKSCTISSNGKAFVRINHSKNSDCLKVVYSGFVIRMTEFEDLEVHQPKSTITIKKQPLRGGKFIIGSEKQFDVAIQLLSNFSPSAILS